MKKTLLFLIVLLAGHIVFAQKNACEGKPVPFYMSGQIDINGDGTNEKFYMCESSKEKNKTLLRVLNGKTNKIIVSTVFDINPKNAVKETPDFEDAGAGSNFSISIFEDSNIVKGPYRFIRISGSTAYDDFGAVPFLPKYLVMHNGVYLGFIEKYDETAWSEAISFDREEIKLLDIPRCWNDGLDSNGREISADKKTPCIAVYRIQKKLLNPYFSEIYTSSSDDIVRVYIVEKGILKEIYKSSGNKLSWSPLDPCKDDNLAEKPSYC